MIENSSLKGVCFMKYNKTKTRTKIMEAGLDLFLSQGYEETTISQILEKSGTSRSAFYHHFHGKEELLFSVAYMYDDEYDLWLENYDGSLHTVDILISFNKFVAENLENSRYRDLYPSLYGLQVTTSGIRHILNPDRRYYKILREILKKGQEAGEISTEHSYAELADMITSFQIGMTYNWCLQQHRYSLPDYFSRLLNPFLESLSTKK